MNNYKENPAQALILVRQDGAATKIEREIQEYDLLTSIVAPERAEELEEALAKAKDHFPHLGVTKNQNDTLAQLIAYHGIFKSFTPKVQSRPVVIILREEPTAPYVARYQNYCVFEPESELTHKVIKTAQVPMSGSPFLTLAVFTLHLDEHGIPEIEKSFRRIYPEPKQEQS